MTIVRKSRSGDYLLWRVRVEDAYRAAGMHAEADRWADCSDPANFFNLSKNESLPKSSVGAIVCSNDPEHYAKSVCPSCDFRTCPDCAHRHSARLLNRYMPALQELFDKPKKGWRFRKIELTTGISLLSDNLKNDINDLYESIRVLFEQCLDKTQVKDCGFIIAHEFGETGLKLHFHILYYGPYIDQKDLSDVWRSLTGWSIVWIKQIGKYGHYETLQAAVAETLKYCTKLWKRDRKGNVHYIKPRHVPVLHRAIASTRRVRSWGMFYNLQEPKAPAQCPTCEARLLKLSPTEHDIYLQTGWLPDDLLHVLRAVDLPLLHSKPADKSPVKIRSDEPEQEKLL